jgi:hypothetical protein
VTNQSCPEIRLSRDRRPCVIDLAISGYREVVREGGVMAASQSTQQRLVVRMGRRQVDVSLTVGYFGGICLAVEVGVPSKVFVVS